MKGKGKGMVAGNKDRASGWSSHALYPRIPLEPGRVDDGVKDLLLEDRLAPRHPRLLLFAVAQTAGDRAIFIP